MEPKIEGLTKKQVAMLDIMWSIEDADDIEKFVRSLPMQDRIQAQCLLIMLTHELLEEFLEGVTKFPDAQEVIDRVKNA